MSNYITDIFRDDAFSMSSLTAAFNELDHVPGRAGQVVFAGIGEGVSTLEVSIESQGDSLALIQSSPRGAPAPQEVQSKRKLRNFHIPQIKLEDVVHAHQVQNVRKFGDPETGENISLLGTQEVVNTQLQKMLRRHDLTLESHRLGALKGVIKDADGSTLLDLFAGLDILNSDGQPEPETFDFDLGNPNADIRATCQAIKRAMYRTAKVPIPSTGLIWAFVGDDFFDTLISHPNVKKAVAGVPAAAEKLSGNFAFGAYEFGSIIWENYQGTDDDSATIGIAPDEARFFFVGVPGLYAEYFAPADFLDTVNTPGLPRYARLALDKQFKQKAEIHTQQNPLPMCLRPQTLMRGITGISA